MTKNLIQCVFVLLLLAACASIGSPDGGPYDETPPRVVRSNPDNQAVNANQKKIRIDFDEYIKLENASEKVVVSPPQTEAPNVRAAFIIFLSTPETVSQTISTSWKKVPRNMMVYFWFSPMPR